jgi:hypothetical protein
LSIDDKRPMFHDGAVRVIHLDERANEVTIVFKVPDSYRAILVFDKLRHQVRQNGFGFGIEFTPEACKQTRFTARKLIFGIDKP